MSMEPESRRTMRRQGPAMLRGRAIPKTTTDQRLLDRRGPSDWVHTDPWRGLRVPAEFVEGVGPLAELGPAGSVFCSARTGRGRPADHIAQGTAAGPGRGGCSWVNGRGPGALRAATKGAPA